MTELVPFEFEGAEVRALIRKGEPWFVLGDVGRGLGVANPSKAARRLDDDEKETLDGIEGLAAPRGRAVTVISEIGLYQLFAATTAKRTPAARRFKLWMLEEVLPDIRAEAMLLRAKQVLEATVEREKAGLADTPEHRGAAARLMEQLTTEWLPSLRKDGIDIAPAEGETPHALALRFYQARLAQIEALKRKAAENKRRAEEAEAKADELARRRAELDALDAKLAPLDAKLLMFEYEGETIRTRAREDDPWAVLREVCGALGAGDPADAARRLEADEERILAMRRSDDPGTTLTTRRGRSGGGDARACAVIGESGLHILVLCNRKAAAKRDGSNLFDYEAAAIHVRTREGEPWVLLDEVCRALNAGDPRQALVLRALRALQGSDALSDPATPGSTGALLGCPSKIAAGFLKNKVTVVLRDDGTEKMEEQLLITRKGLAQLALMLRPPGQLLS